MTNKIQDQPNVDDGFVRELENFPTHLRGAMEAAVLSMRAYNKEIAEDYAEVSESYFVNNMLPILTNRVGGQNVTIWQDVAGTSTRPIRVVSDDTGTELFIVPPLLRHINKQFRGTKENSPFNIITTAIQKSNVLPVLGTKHLEKKMINKMTGIAPNYADVITWNKILKRYNLETFIDDKYLVSTEDETKDKITNEPVIEKTTIESTKVEVVGYEEL